MISSSFLKIQRRPLLILRRD